MPSDRIGIGAAAARTGVTERALRYYQELGLICPSGQTTGGSRLYSQAVLDRVFRIRELQAILGLNLEEIARVLHNEDRTAEIRAHFGDNVLTIAQRRQLLNESLSLSRHMRDLVEAKRAALEGFVTDLDQRINRIRSVLAEAPHQEAVGTK